jgi:rubrerythrin
MPQLPDNIRFLEKSELDQAVLRVAIMAEFDCINTYEQILALVKEGELRDILLQILSEDKAHAQALQDNLSRRDKPEREPSEAPVPNMDEGSYEY